jgi:hypothetical protein
MESPREKKCTKCGITKSISEFSRHSKCLNGLRSYCRSCASICNKKYKSKKPLYDIWKGIISRCNNPNDIKYKYYGGRGIKVCERWLEYKNFEADMLPTYKKGLQIDRINNDGDYEPNNCHWVTAKENVRNRRDTLKVNAFGKCYILGELAEKYGIEYHIVWHRIYRDNWDIEKAVECPKIEMYRRPPSKRIITLNGDTKSLSEWSKITGIGYKTLHDRLSKGWSPERALTAPVRKSKNVTV